MQTRLKEELDKVQQEFDNKDWTCPYEGWNEDAQALSQIGYSTGSKYIDSTPHLGHFAGGVAPSC